MKYGKQLKEYIVKQANEGATLTELSEGYGISKSTISRWVKELSSVVKESSTKTTSKGKKKTAPKADAKKQSAEISATEMSSLDFSILQDFIFEMKSTLEEIIKAQTVNSVGLEAPLVRKKAGGKQILSFEEAVAPNGKYTVMYQKKIAAFYATGNHSARELSEKYLVPIEEVRDIIRVFAESEEIKLFEDMDPFAYKQRDVRTLIAKYSMSGAFTYGELIELFGIPKTTLSRLVNDVKKNDSCNIA